MFVATAQKCHDKDSYPKPIAPKDTHILVIICLFVAEASESVGLAGESVGENI